VTDLPRQTVRKCQERDVDVGYVVEVVGPERAIATTKMRLHFAKEATLLGVRPEMDEVECRVVVDEPNDLPSGIPGCTDDCD
jgi:hypothetical protein